MFLNLLENLKAGAAYKRLAYKKARQNKIAKLFTDYFRTCRYIELEPTEIQNAKTSTAFLKRGEYIENEKFLLRYDGTL